MMSNLARIMIRPRETMRRILDAGPDRTFLVIVLLATISSYIGDLDRAELNFIRVRGAFGIAVTIGVMIGVTALFIGFFYLYAWVLFWIGRAFEGKGTPREVRSAAGWGLVPIIWMLVYRVPLVIFMRSAVPWRMQLDDKNFSFDPGQIGAGCIAAMLIAVLELGMLIWCAVVSSNTIAEAHRFETWRGFVTLLFTAASPIVIVLAAVLAS